MNFGELVAAFVLGNLLTDAGISVSVHLIRKHKAKQTYDKQRIIFNELMAQQGATQEKIAELVKKARAEAAREQT